MLFLVDAGGVPSEAAILRLGQKTWEPPREDTGLATAPAPSGGGCSSAAPGAAPLLAGGALAAFLLAGAMRRRPPGPRSLRRS